MGGNEIGKSKHSFLSIPPKTSNFHSFQNLEELDLGLMKILLELLKNTPLILAFFTHHDTFFSQPKVQTYPITLALSLNYVAYANILLLVISPSNPVSLSISLIY